MTANAEWEEIRRLLPSYQKSVDRPDIVVRAFRERLVCMLNEILHGEDKHPPLFGDVVAYIYVIEFQKRGMYDTN